MAVQIIIHVLIAPKHPSVSQYEISTVTVDSAPNENTDSEGDKSSFDHSHTATSLVRQLLKGMPRRKVELHEVAIQQEIHTAIGVDDSYEDIRRPKHTCVTEPHKLTEEQLNSILEEVKAEFPYTPESNIR